MSTIKKAKWIVFKKRTNLKTISFKKKRKKIVRQRVWHIKYIHYTWHLEGTAEYPYFYGNVPAFGKHWYQKTVLLPNHFINKILRQVKILVVFTKKSRPPLPISPYYFIFFFGDKKVTKFLSSWPDPGLKKHKIVSSWPVPPKKYQKVLKIAKNY